MLVNARHVKNLPGPQDRRRGRDLAGPARRARPGPGSFVPPEPIRQLRDLTRTRTAITRERGREVQRLEKLLEDAGIKLSAVATDIIGVSGRAMLEALIAGRPRPGRAGRPGQAPAAGQDPGADRGADRPVHRAPRVPGPGAPGPDRPAHRRDRGAHRADRGGDGALSGLPRPDLHHPRDRHHRPPTSSSPRPAPT